MFSLRSFPNVQIMLLITIGVLLSVGCASVPKPIPLISFKSTPSKIDVGETAILSWSVSNADSIIISPFDGSLAASGVKSIAPVITTTYQLTAYYGEKSISHNVEVVVNKPQPKMEEQEKLTPIVEEKNTTPSKYPKGNTPANEVTSLRYSYEIFGSDVSGYPNEIKLYVTVQDENGNLITNLAPPYASELIAKDYFRSINEEINGKIFQVEKFKVEEIHDQKREPYSFALVLDHSGSMEKEIRFLENGVREFVKRKNPNDEIAALKFDQFYQVEVPLTQSKDEFLQQYKFAGLSGYGGNTGLYAAAGDAVDNIAKYGKYKHKALILFTDGWDNASPMSVLYFGKGSPDAAELIEKARKLDVSIFVVTMGERQKVDEPTLQTVAAYTGGNYQNIQRGSEIQDLFDGLPRKFSNYYVLTFTPHKADGERTTNITVKNEGNQTTSASRRLATGKVDVSQLANFFKKPVTLGRFTEGKAEESGLNKEVITIFANYVKSHPDKIVEIYGHASLKGSSTTNQVISLKRAQLLKQQLVKAGVKEKSIKAYGLGSTKPLHKPEIFDWMSAENRRVEVVLVDR